MKTIEQFHLAAQYLATAGKSFLPHKKDDSHTNLGFSITDQSLLTWPLDESGIQLGLNYSTFSLDWKSDTVHSLSLKGKTHGEVVEWISKMAKTSGLMKPYRFDLHYSLPYTMANDQVFQLSDSSEVQELIRLRSLAQNVLTTFLKDENLESEVRVWPHHFDTGAFAHLHNGSGKSVGLGLAIPDEMVNDFYFYISGYRGNTQLRTWAFKPLAQGTWKNNGFKGAILPASDITEATTSAFFRQALKAYKS